MSRIGLPEHLTLIRPTHCTVLTQSTRPEEVIAENDVGLGQTTTEDITPDNTNYIGDLSWMYRNILKATNYLLACSGGCQHTQPEGVVHQGSSIQGGNVKII